MFHRQHTRIMHAFGSPQRLNLLNETHTRAVGLWCKWLVLKSARALAPAHTLALKGGTCTLHTVLAHTFKFIFHLRRNYFCLHPLWWIPARFFDGCYTEQRKKRNPKVEQTLLRCLFGSNAVGGKKIINKKYPTCLRIYSPPPKE